MVYPIRRRMLVSPLRRRVRFNREAAVGALIAFFSIMGSSLLSAGGGWFVFVAYGEKLCLL
jgi:hypothetical protein